MDRRHVPDGEQHRPDLALSDVKKVLDALAKARKRPTLKRTRMIAIAICRYAVGHYLDRSPLSDVDWTAPHEGASGWFGRMASKTAQLSGKPATFLAATLIGVVRA